MVLSAMRGDSALSRGAGNELSGKSDLPVKEERSRIQSLQTDEGITRSLKSRAQDTVYCADEDYETAEMIGNKLLMHVASAYRLIDGDAQEVVPEIKPIDQRKVLFEQLKAEYDHKALAEEAKRQGVSKRTAERWNLSWIENGLVLKINYGQYRKVA